jgi:molecular chaperone DnaJ
MHEVARNNGWPNGAPPTEPSLRGPDVRRTVRLTLREAAFGANKTIEVPRREVCGRCHGTGAAPAGKVRQCPRCHGTGRGARPGEECPRCHGNGGIPTVPCPFCDGRGRVESSPAFPLHFPPAVEDGEVLRIKNEGDPGPQGGPRGDLHLRVEVEPDPVLRRCGSEVYADLSITPEQAAQGGRIDVPTLHGSSHLTLPEGVPDGSRFVMRGKGLRLKGKWRRGDQHVTIHVKPSAISNQLTADY